MFKKGKMRMKKGILTITIAAMVFMLGACGSQNADNGGTSANTTVPISEPAGTQAAKPISTQQNDVSETPEIQQENNKQENKEEETVNIVIEMQDGGIIKAELYPETAPLTVANFEKLVNEHFYDGLIFHRVISGFMIQGGGFDTNMVQKETEPIKGEFASNGVENDLKHERGVLSMARTSVKDSATSQFFIMHETSPHLDGEYAAFGKVTEGMDVVDKIAAVKTDSGDCPVEPVVIKSITIAE